MPGTTTPNPYFDGPLPVGINGKNILIIFQDVTRFSKLTSFLMRLMSVNFYL